MVVSNWNTKFITENGKNTKLFPGKEFGFWTEICGRRTPALFQRWCYLSISTCHPKPICNYVRISKALRDQKGLRTAFRWRTPVSQEGKTVSVKWAISLLAVFSDPGEAPPLFSYVSFFLTDSTVRREIMADSRFLWVQLSPHAVLGEKGCFSGERTVWRGFKFPCNLKPKVEIKIMNRIFWH